MLEEEKAADLGLDVECTRHGISVVKGCGTPFQLLLAIGRIGLVKR